MTDYVSNLNGLIILTSVSFAIAQYFDTKHNRDIQGIKDTLEENNYLKTLLSSKNMNIENSFIEKMRKSWDTVRNARPLSIHKFIIVFLSLLLMFSFLHYLIFMCPDYFYILLPIISGFLLIIIVLMMFRLFQMKKQYDTIKKEIENLEHEHTIFKAAEAFFDQSQNNSNTH